MKKIIACSFAFCLAALLPISALAYSTKTYAVDEIGISVTVPSEFDVITQDINNPLYGKYADQYGVTKEELLSHFKSSNIYLDIIDAENGCEYLVQKTEPSGLDFSVLNDDMLKDGLSSIKATMENNGFTVTNADIYQNGQAKYLRVSCNQIQSGQTSYYIEYLTEAYGKSFMIIANSIGSKINFAAYTQVKAIVDSVDFRIDEASASSASAFVYTDPETTVEFTVPAGWEQKPLSKTYDMLKTKFMKDDNPALVITYGWMDIWGSMTSSERAGLSRSDIDNSSEISKSFTDELSNVQTVLLGNNEYFKTKDTQSTTKMGLTVDTTMTSLYCFDNGYVYMIQFSGDENNAYYSDFESLAKSVVFKGKSTNTTIVPTSTATPTKTTNKPAYSINWTVVLLSLILTIAIYSLPIFIYRYAILKEPLPQKKAKTVTIVYAVIAFIVMQLIKYAINGENSSAPSSGAIVIWSFVNYKVLTGGESKKKEPTIIETKYYSTPILSKPEETIPEIPQSQISHNDEPISGNGAVDLYKQANESPDLSNDPSEEQDCKSILDTPELNMYSEKEPEIEIIKPASVEPIIIPPTVGRPIVPCPDCDSSQPEECETIICAQCGKAINNDSEFCCFCGSKIIKFPPPLKVLYCRKCGYKLTEGSLFCSKCGFKVVSDSNDLL